MPQQKKALRFIIFLGVFSWLGILASGYLFRVSEFNNSNSDVYLLLSKALLIVFIVTIYFFYKKNIGEQEAFNIIDLLWKVFVTGLIATVVSLLSSILYDFLKGHELRTNLFFLDTIYLINVGLIITFLIAAFAVWKRLILYQKSKWLIRNWNIFEYGLLGSSLLFFTTIEVLSSVSLVVSGVLVVLGVILSVNLKWVAYLNFKQKLKSILLIILIGLYIAYFYSRLISYEDDKGFKTVFEALGVTTITVLFIFTLIYCVSSVLVILFNLPTSSVFEQKLVEVVNFQRLSQSSNTGQGEEQVLDILLESSVSVVLANAAWLDIMEADEKPGRTIYFKTNKEEKVQILNSIKGSKIKKVQSSVPSRNKNQGRFTAELKHETYKSIFFIPLFIQEKQIASMALLKDVNDGFSKEMIDILRTFINQASISIENYRLMKEAIVNERYKEELKIAKRVQDSLLPKMLHSNDDIEICAFSKAAAEVGGDYFDTYKMDSDRLAIIVGDVSGKGTSAAFHMSQMKGIFQSLVQLNLSAREFIIKANNALSGCLDRTSFITTTYIILDSSKKKIEFTRAGHCPTLYYSAKDKKVRYLKDNGLGLGILRDHQFEDFVDINIINYNSGDILFLYTDGITEAKNRQNEEFGYDRLKQFLENHVFYSAEYIKEKILETLYDFCETSNLEDDVTALIVKVK